MHSEISIHQKEDTETNKWTQRGLQQTPKWNKRYYIKKDIWIEENNTKYKRRVDQSYGKPQEKESNKSWK
jgi:hypothetical protein